MTDNIVTFRSKTERENDVDLLAKYREIGIAAIAAANQSFRSQKPKKVEIRRSVVYAD